MDPVLSAPIAALPSVKTRSTTLRAIGMGLSDFSFASAPNRVVNNDGHAVGGRCREDHRKQLFSNCGNLAQLVQFLGPFEQQCPQRAQRRRKRELRFNKPACIEIRSLVRRFFWLHSGTHVRRF
jgi:hypothetical protein